jgi:hypothetical protein
VALGENATYLKLEKPYFLFLEGSEGAAAEPVAVTAVLTDAPAALAGAPTVRAASSTDHPAAGACSSAASAALGDGGGGFHLSGGAPIALLFLLLLLLLLLLLRRRRILWSHQGREPLLLV